MAVARGLNDGQPEKIARAVRDAALEFGGRLRDDLQIVAIHFLGATADKAGPDGQMRTAFACDPQRLLETRHAVRDFLTKQGVAVANITSIGLGKSDPVASNDTAAGRQQNRRVEIVISGDVIGAEIGTPIAAR